MLRPFHKSSDSVGFAVPRRVRIFENAGDCTVYRGVTASFFHVHGYRLSGIIGSE